MEGAIRLLFTDCSHLVSPQQLRCRVILCALHWNNFGINCSSGAFGSNRGSCGGLWSRTSRFRSEG